METEVTGEDVILAARSLLGVRSLPGGSNPTTGLDHFGFLTVIGKRLGIVDAATLRRYDSEDKKSAFWNLRRCVVARKFCDEIPLAEIQPGDFVTTAIIAGSGNGWFLGGDQIMLVTSLSPPTYIYLQPYGCLVEEQRDFELSKAFRLRQHVELDHSSIFNEHVKMAMKLEQDVWLANLTSGILNVGRIRGT